MGIGTTVRKPDSHSHSHSHSYSSLTWQTTGRDQIQGLRLGRGIHSSLSLSNSKTSQSTQALTPNPKEPQVTPLIIGIRREDPSRVWERRVPLTPADVKALVLRGREAYGAYLRDNQRGLDCLPFPIHVHIQPSAKRVEDLGEAHVVLGIKEVPVGELDVLEGYGEREEGGVPRVPRTYMMFSHTAKGQEYNMPLLDRFLAEGVFEGEGEDKLLPTLIDYELLTTTTTPSSKPSRTLTFGYHAGVAGALMTLHTLGEYLLREHGSRTPWVYTPLPHLGLPGVLKNNRFRGKEDENPYTYPLPSQGPLIIGLTGSGNVSTGALSMLRELGFGGGVLVEVDVDELPGLVGGSRGDDVEVYIVHVKPEDYLVRKDALIPSSSKNFVPSYTRTSYHASPSSYTSVFMERVGRYLTVLVNGVGWQEGYPRLVGWDAVNKEGLGRLKVVGDISCDLEGGLEFVTRSTTFDEPFYRIEIPSSSNTSFSSNTSPSSSSATSTPNSVPTTHSNTITHPLYIQSIDILPSSLPLDASVHFSKGLGRYVWGVVRGYAGLEREDREIKDALDRATIASGGRLKKREERAYTTLLSQRNIRTFTSSSSTPTTRKNPNPMGPKRVLILGTGMVAAPAVRWIVRRIVGGRGVDTENEENKENKDEENKDEEDKDEEDKDEEGKIDRLVKEVDVVISLLPPALHVPLARLCITHQTHLITPSYISSEMRALDGAARNAGNANAISNPGEGEQGILILCEIGLDPGLDHVGAVELVERARTGAGESGEREREWREREIQSFVSFCGGLPEPRLTMYPPSGGPLSYKFSWSPGGVLEAALNGARYVLDGTENMFPASDLLFDFENFRGEGLEGLLEGIPNRDSLPYASMYGLDANSHQIRTLLRGTLRYKGFSALMDRFRNQGFLDRERRVRVDDLAEVSKNNEEEEDPLERPLAWLTSADTGTPPLSHSNSTWIGLPPLTLPSDTSDPSIPQTHMSPIDLFIALLSHKLQYGSGERDMVVLVHEVVTRGIHTSSLVIFGSHHPTQRVNVSGAVEYEYESAMARSVGIPVAVAALAVLDGSQDTQDTQDTQGIPLRGVHGPTHPSIRTKILEGMAQAGLGMREDVRSVKVRVRVKGKGRGRVPRSGVQKGVGNDNDSKSGGEDLVLGSDEGEGRGVKGVEGVEGVEGVLGKPGLEYGLIRLMRVRREREIRKKEGLDSGK
ncbi:Saccharopine dehydrogenase-domain-containing protein [Lentinula raphanica]|nr:Saccharopine dehydrogenase-domain-containing protein [Lentinula raphanica]